VTFCRTFLVAVAILCSACGDDEPQPVPDLAAPFDLTIVPVDDLARRPFDLVVPRDWKARRLLGALRRLRVHETRNAV
jgi:hypothetical protein